MGDGERYKRENEDNKQRADGENTSQKKLNEERRDKDK